MDRDREDASFRERRQMVPKDEVKAIADEAVRDALVNEHLSNHEKRIQVLEKFRWYLLTTVAIGSLSSAGSLLLLLLEKKGP